MKATAIAIVVALVSAPAISMAGGGVVKRYPAFDPPHSGHLHHGHRHYGNTPAPSVFPGYVDPWKGWGVRQPPVHVYGSHGHTGYHGYGAGDSRFYDLPPAPRPFPRVVEYPHGYYQLHGNGVTAPYEWVWVPKHAR